MKEFPSYTAQKAEALLLQLQLPEPLRLRLLPQLQLQLKLRLRLPLLPLQRERSPLMIRITAAIYPFCFMRPLRWLPAAELLRFVKRNKP